MLLSLTALAACAGSDESVRMLRVSAAASLHDVVTELALDFEERSRTGVSVELNFAGSNVLAQQIHATPQADVFLSADKIWVDDLLSSHRLEAGSQRTVFANQLVLVARHDAELTIDGLKPLADSLGTDRSLVMADPEAVPAGRYAKSYLVAEGLWKRVESQLVPALDVRAALALIETDPALVGFVYRTDATTSDRIETLFELPSRDGIDIVYWGGLVAKDSPHGEAAAFLEYLGTPAALAVAERHGFLPPTSRPPTQ